MNEPRKYRNYQFRIRTENGNLVNTYARGYDPENAKYHLWKQYPNAVIVEMLPPPPLPPLPSPPPREISSRMNRSPTAAVSTSCPRRLHASTAGSGKFSSAQRRANGYASSCSRSCRSSPPGCAATEAQALTKSAARSPRPKR